MKQSSWGGQCAGAGRKRSAEPTVTIRVPVSSKETIMHWVQQLKIASTARIPSWMAVVRLTPQSTPQSFPRMNQSVRAGFPSPADDYVEKCIDLNEECYTTAWKELASAYCHSDNINPASQ